MANVKSGKESLRLRATRRVARAVGGDLVQRIADLEAEVQESRNLNLRVAELVDVVSELLVPIASQDQAKIQEAIAKFEKSL